MKQIIIVLIFALSSTAGIAQAKLEVSFADFQAWAKQIKIAGYPFIESEQDGADYSAMLGSGPNKAFQIRLMKIGSFNEYKMTSKDATVYTLNGFKAVYHTHANISILALELPQAQASISYAMNGNIPKTTMEELATKSNLQNLKVSDYAANASGVKWPAVIPTDMRISSVEAIEVLGSDGTYKDVIEVKATLSPALIASVEAILKKYDGELSLIQTDSVDFICSSAESITQLKSDFKTGETVSFMYYIKK